MSAEKHEVQQGVTSVEADAVVIVDSLLLCSCDGVVMLQDAQLCLQLVGAQIIGVLAIRSHEVKDASRLQVGGRFPDPALGGGPACEVACMPRGASDPEMP